MAYPATHGDPSGRRAITVAELLARPTSLAPVTPAVPDWVVPPLSRRQRAARTAGALLAAGSILAVTALAGSPEHGPMGSSAEEGGYPEIGLPPAAIPPARPATTERAARPVAARSAARPARAPGARLRTARAGPTHDEPTGAVRTAAHPEPEPPAGSALSRLTPRLNPERLLDVLG